MNKEPSSTVDTRFLKSGQVRLRFKLNERGLAIATKALSMTGYKYDNSSLDAISMNYLAGHLPTFTLNYPVRGAKRFLVKLYLDEYEVVRAALTAAQQFVKSDDEALVLICLIFISTGAPS